MQVGGSLPGHPRRFASVRECARHTVAVGGTRSLYRGLLPNLVRSVHSLALSYLVFEHCKLRLSGPGVPGPRSSAAAAPRRSVEARADRPAW